MSEKVKKLIFLNRVKEKLFSFFPTSFDDWARTISVQKVIRNSYYFSIVVFVYMLGGITADLIGVYYFQPSLPSAKYSPPISKVKDKTIPYASFDPVIKANIFQTEVVEFTEGSGNVVRTEASQLAALFELKGTLVFSAKIQYAFILNKSSGTIEQFGLGDDIFTTGFKLKEAGKGYVVLTNGTNDVRLELPETPDDINAIRSPSTNDASVVAPASPQTSAASTAAPKVSLPVNKKSSSATQVAVVNGRADVSLPSDQIESAMKDFSKLLQEARVVPQNDDSGKLLGYIIKNIVKGSFYETLGLQNGDVIKSVNNENIDSPEKAVTLFKLFRNEKQINLSIERDNQPISLNYFIQ